MRRQVIRDLGDDVAMVLAHVADGRDPDRAAHLEILKGGDAIREPFRRHAIVAQLVEQIARLLILRQQLEHPKVERRGTVQQRAGVRVYPERRRGAAIRPERVDDAEGDRDHRHERRGGADGHANERQIHFLDTALRAVRLDVLALRMVIGHEEVVVDLRHAPSVARPSGGELSTMQCSPRGNRSLLGSRSRMCDRSTSDRVCGCPSAPVRMRTSLAPR